MLYSQTSVVVFGFETFRMENVIFSSLLLTSVYIMGAFASMDIHTHANTALSRPNLKGTTININNTNSILSYTSDNVISDRQHKRLDISGSSNKIRDVDFVQNARGDIVKFKKEEKPKKASTLVMGLSENTPATSNKCKLVVTTQSKSDFEMDVLKYWHNFVRMDLRFTGLNVSAASDVIDSRHWVWTYKGTNGAYQYLFLPNDFSYLSFGLLWMHTRVQPIEIVFSAINASLCSDLVIGHNDTDQAIGDALGDMTGSRLTATSDKFNSSYWCYHVRLYLSESTYSACRRSICTFQTIEYRCCKFQIDYLTSKRTVKCRKEHYHYGRLWWVLPILIGEISFLLYPFLLTTIGCRVSKLRRKDEQRQTVMSDHSARTMESDAAMATSVSVDMESVLKRSTDLRKHSKPVTLMSTLISPICRWHVHSKLFTRLGRVLFFLLPMSLSMIRVGLDYTYANNFTQSAVRTGALVGFSSMITGWDLSRQSCLIQFGGPFIAIALYVIFGFIFILVPNDFETFLEKGIFKLNGVSSSPILLSIDSKERLGGVHIRKAKGYTKVHKYLFAQLYVLLNWRFWSQTMKLFVFRLSNAYNAMRLLFGSSRLAKCAVFLLALPYIIVCVVEILVTIVYFAFPAISCFFILLKAYLCAVVEWLADRPRTVRWITKLLFIPLLVIFSFTWYMYCLIFFDGTWFLSKIAMFTYSGIIAYPRESYGYLILTLMAVYYLFESVNGFGAGYQELLGLSIDACQKLEKRAARQGTRMEILHEKGISTELFDVIIERCRPRRIQVVSTFLKFGAILLILNISIELLMVFDKLQDLSLVSHVFTVLFICALPKIIKTMCVTTNHVRKKLLKQKIMRTVHKYVQNEQPEEISVYESGDRHRLSDD